MVFAIHKTRCATSLTTTSLSMRNRGIQRYLVHTTTYTELLLVIIYYDLVLLVGGRSPQTPHWHDDGVTDSSYELGRRCLFNYPRFQVDRNPSDLGML